MGADARIHIWSAVKVADAWPDGDKLFGLIPTHYKDELCGSEYHHVYEGDGMYVYWEDVSDSYASEEEKPRLKEFIGWLIKNEDACWEVWT